MAIPRQARAWIDRLAVVAAIAGPVYYVGAFLYVALSRMSYPFSLEWLEGGSFAQVQRVLTGQPLYARPSLEYVAMIYPPLYYFAGAALSRLIGFGFLPLRVVSFAASLGCMVMIYAICAGEATRRLPALMASGLFAATYYLCGSWFDIARVDMMSMFFMLCSIWLLRRQTSGAVVAAGVMIALACLTKQSHLITLACLALFLLVRERRTAIPFLLACLVVLGGAYWILNRIYSGWFGFFVLRLAAGSGEYVSITSSTGLQTAAEFWSTAILLALPVAALAIVAYAVVDLRDAQGRKGSLFFLACAVGMVGTSWSVVQVGGYKNDLVPAYGAMAILFGLSIQQLGYGLRPGPRYRAAVLSACAVQFGLLLYPVAPLIPRKGDLEAGRALVNEIRAAPGAVYVPFHPELALMAGKAPYASWSPMFQLEGNYGGGDIRTTARVKTEFVRAMARHEFSMILMDQPANWIWGNPELYYTAATDPVFADADAFWPVTGWQTRPEFRMVPNAP